MAQLSKDELQADAILDAATPPTATESAFPTFPQKKKPTPKKPEDKAARAPALAKNESLEKAASKSNAAPNKAASSNRSNEIVKKAWQQLNAWGLGISGKVIFLLIIIGVFSEIVKHF